MAFITKPHFVLFFVSSTIVLFASATLDLSNVPAEAPSPSDEDGFLPFAKKHVVIWNLVKNFETLNVHCKSSEDDLGMVHIPSGHSWSFKFHVNLYSSTKFHCHFTWHGGGSHYFYIFTVYRDDNPFGKYPVCRECIWYVEPNRELPICRHNRDGSDPYCFKWEDGP
ncbi:unnamed protein product [Cochlearia groenlandica]